MALHPTVPGSTCVLASIQFLPHTYTPCRRTSTALACGYASMAARSRSVSSHSRAVFSMMGMACTL